MSNLFSLGTLTIAMLLPLYAVQAAEQVTDQAAAYAEARAIMQRTTRQLLDRLKTEAKTYAEDERLLYTMLREVVQPVMDMRLIGRLVLGPHWKAANELQKERFIRSFQSALIKNYGKTLLLLPDIRIDYVDYVPSLPQEKDRSRRKYQIVRTKVMTSANQPPLSVNYSLIDREGWKVFDIIIDGTSIVRQFRSSFDQEIRETGFEALLERLEKFDATPAGS